MTNTEETLAEVTVEEEVQALNTQPSGRPARHIDDNKAYKELSEFHERAISECGIGRFHWMLLAACGMGLAADTAELLVLGFVLPSAEVDFCISQTEKRVLGVVTYTGLATGALLWGCMADRVGRRRTLLTAMTLAAIFDLMAALMPTFGTFLTARLLGGIGLGGSLPILIAYFSEFIPRPQRVKFLCALLACWAFGGIYVALMAWAILPKTGVMVVLDGQEHFSAWHIFLIVCAIPTPLAVIGLLALPESPRILLQIGHESEALVIYQRIFQKNHPKLTVDEYKVSETDLPSSQKHKLRRENSQDDKDQATSHPTTVRQKSILSVLSYTLVNFGSLISKIFAANHRRATLPIIVTWVFASFGYYGLSLWFPEYVKYLKGQDFKLKASTLMNVSYSDIQFNQSIENMIYVNGRFTNVRFQNLILNHVVFDSCHFEQVSFIKIKSSRSLFRNSTILQSTFVDTDFFPYRFEGCHMEDTTFDSMDAFCPLDFDYNIHLGEVFLEQLIGELSLIPGLVLAALLMDRFGRARLISISLLLCSLLTLTLAAVQSPEAVIGVEAAFNVFFAVGLASLTVASTETCPTYIRATGWGLINTLSRGAGLAGLFVYDSMLECTVLASCFVTSGVMLTSAVVSLLIIETRHTLL
ncbi:synaptic vesicle glycoprotein 2A-like [Daphnia pulex]|uniref:synaptic vesicle glycoprotein 2A-like n=1 Tax=Daphnia pulex TaxID=6669 RepID=UPI001EE15371|nr:synaptic vesicle glycoprotein 2A-like [Daphnia pulex]